MGNTKTYFEHTEIKVENIVQIENDIFLRTSYHRGNLMRDECVHVVHGRYSIPFDCSEYVEKTNEALAAVNSPLKVELTKH